MENQNQDYFIGLDMGTDSVGWAVTDTDYKIGKFKGNAMWGVRLFDESNTAQERRMFRTSRRRNQRTKERLALLEMLFDNEITKKDDSFFQRLKESSFYLEDKSSAQKYTLFNGDYTDKDFYNEYPTVYHLRKALIEGGREFDARLVFLALHHIIKNRGHFLFDDMNTSGISDFKQIINSLLDYLHDNYALELSCSDYNELESVVKSRRFSKSVKREKIAELFNVTKKTDPQEFACLSLLSGCSTALCDIFNDESLKDEEKKNIIFDGKYAENELEYQSILAERYELIEKIKSVYDWGILADILNGETYLSYAKVNVYERHKKDLKSLKTYIKKYIPEKYNEVFKNSKKGLKNYVAYSGHIKENNGKTGVLNETACNQQEFCEYLRKKVLGECVDASYEEMFTYIESGTFMPKQKNADNGVIPMQLNRAELVKILDNACEYLPFLNEKDKDGISVYNKIISLFDYRIPYYVGPLNKHSDKAWLERTGEKIYPWNFNKVVDIDKSAQKFIENLTSKCTYLPQEDVIPKNSILYSRFMVLDELNNLRLDSEKIDVSLKQEIFNDLFLKYNKITGKKLEDYLKSRNIDFTTVSGIDGDFKANMKSYRDFQSFENLTDEDKENIIKLSTIFGDDRKLLRKQIRENYSDKLTADEIKKVSKLKYTGWSKLSKKFLTQVESVNKETGEVVNIINAMWDTNENLMQLIYSDNYSFEEAIRNENRFDKPTSIKNAVDDLYVSPKVKRPIYQSLLIVKEIEKIKKAPPKKIFVEVARYEGVKKRTKTRKDTLLELYKFCKKENQEIYEELCKYDNDSLKSDKLYLYFTQMGRCIYTGEEINLNELMGQNSRWDIDHIFPRSKIKDDSLDNRVLSNKQFNNNIKKNYYPLSDDVRKNRNAYWKMLLGKGLISKKKFERLNRATQLTDEELNSFIARQLVETSQSTKAAAGILKDMYPDTEIVYVKAGLVSEFRHEYDMLKCREVNDFHHAKDAYLNIVVGNVYNVKAKHNKNFISDLKNNVVSLNKMFQHKVDGEMVNDDFIPFVKATMQKNNIRYTRYSFCNKGTLFKQTIQKKGNGQIPIKASGPKSNISKYGAYHEAKAAYYCLVEHGTPKNRKIALAAINIVDLKEFKLDAVKYLLKQYNLKDATIIIEKINIQSCFSFDDFRVHLGGKDSGGKKVVYRPAVQLALPYEQEKYIKNIFKFLNKKSENKERKVNKFDGISADENNTLYSIFISKMKYSIYSKIFNDFGIELEKKQEVFSGLSLEEQCNVISEILKVLHCNSDGCDLKIIGITNNQKIRKTMNISSLKFSSIKLINQSVTGLYEQEIELLK